VKTNRFPSLFIAVVLGLSIILLPGTALAISTNDTGYYETTKSNVEVHSSASGSSSVLDVIVLTGRVIYISEVVKTSWGTWWGKIGNGQYATSGIYKDGSTLYSKWVGGWVYLANILGATADARKHTHSHEEPGGYQGKNWEFHYQSDNSETHTRTAKVSLYCRCGYVVKYIDSGSSIQEPHKFDENGVCEYCKYRRDVALRYTFTDEKYPSGSLTKGAPFNIAGNIESSFTIQSLTVEIIRASNQTPVQSKTIYPNAKTAALAGPLNTAIAFGALETGQYYYRVTMRVANVDAAVPLRWSEFSIADAVISKPLRIVGVSAGAYQMELGETIHWTVQTADATGGVQFSYKVYHNGSLVAESPFMPTNVYQYTPQYSGSYQLAVMAKDSVDEAEYTTVKPVVVVDTSIPLTGISLNEEWVNLVLGDTAQLIPAFAPEGAAANVAWSSDDEAVASVDANGLVAGKGLGMTYITAETLGGSGLSAYCVVEVYEATPSPVAVLVDYGVQGVSFAWSAVENTISYDVYRAVDGGALEYYMTTSGTDFVDYDVQANHTYQYAVEAWLKNNGVGSPLSNVLGVSIPAEPTLPISIDVTLDKTTVAPGGTITATWQVQNGRAPLSVRCFWYVKQGEADPDTAAMIDDAGTERSAFSPPAGTGGFVIVIVSDSDGESISEIQYFDMLTPGDATNDGTIDILDLVSIIDYIVSNTDPSSLSNADANRDGTVDIMDLVWIIDRIVGG